MCNTPSFWYKTKSYISYILLPLAFLYSLIVYIRNKFTIPKKARIPVICIGNIIAGGAGKTPVAIAIAKALLAHNIKVAFVTRGYKGNTICSTKVDLSCHTASHVGDEALLLAKIAPVYINKDRYNAIETAVNHGIELVIMDDGLQNPTIYKDIKVLVIDGLHGIGNGYLIPAGPLRETLVSALKKIDYVIIIGDDKNSFTSKVPINIPVIKASVEITNNLELKDKKFLAFTGIGLPNKFFNTLTKNGAQIILRKIFPDHYQYTTNDLYTLKKLAKTCNADLITTEKDIVRLKPDDQKHIIIVPIETKLGEIFIDMLIKHIKKLLP
ncbi:MAG: tetraacyldisaccharide 4'-kinase [Rickettsiales endosymbiont of Dermacentor nuttalli]